MSVVCQDQAVNDPGAALISSNRHESQGIKRDAR